MSIGPVKVFAAIRSSRFVPVLTSVPLPLMTPAIRCVTSCPPKISEPLLIMVDHV